MTLEGKGSVLIPQVSMGVQRGQSKSFPGAFGFEGLPRTPAIYVRPMLLFPTYNTTCCSSLALDPMQMKSMNEHAGIANDLQAGPCYRYQREACRTWL